MHDFLYMGGYAGYVWSAFGLTAAVLIVNVWLARRRHALALARARRTVRAGGGA